MFYSVFRNNSHLHARAQSLDKLSHSTEVVPLLKTHTSYRSSYKRKCALLIIYTFFTVHLEIQQRNLVRHDKIFDWTAAIVHHGLEC